MTYGLREEDLQKIIAGVEAKYSKDDISAYKVADENGTEKFELFINNTGILTMLPDNEGRYHIATIDADHENTHRNALMSFVREFTDQ